MASKSLTPPPAEMRTSDSRTRPFGNSSRDAPLLWCANLARSRPINVKGLSESKKMIVVEQTLLKSGWDTVLFGGPLIGFLLIGFFRLDEIFSAPKRVDRRHRARSAADPQLRPEFSDPDGRPWRIRRPVAASALRKSRD